MIGKNKNRKPLDFGRTTYIRLLDLNCNDVAARADQILRAGPVKMDEKLPPRGT